MLDITIESKSENVSEVEEKDLLGLENGLCPEAYFNHNSHECSSTSTET